MKITKEWLNNQRTADGGFTRRQVEVLGVAWPPPTGWLQEQVGREITFDLAFQFERAGRGTDASYVV